ncbi:MAG: hypothetical protein K2N89_09195 [Lachnospiraceae bacterium]|nr:hypothetical protein [Lachnospiraceae bacterium]
MFVSGDADITFSDIKLTVNGKQINITTGEEISDTEEPGATDDTKIPADAVLKTISLDSKKIKVEAANVVYAKKQPYAITVTYTYEKQVNGETVPYQQQLTEGLHYTVEPGSVDLTLEGPKTVALKGTKKKTDLGTFTGETTATYTVLPKKNNAKTDISKLKTIAFDKKDIKDLSYTGNYIIPEVQGVGELDEANYKIVYKNNVNAGKASATVIGQNDYYGTKVLTYTIKPTDLSKPTGVLKLFVSDNEISKNGKVYDAGEFDYKGSPVTLENLITLKYEGKKLRPQEDYTITYKVNVQKLTGTATVKGVNNFKGSIKIGYKMKIDKDIIKTETGALKTLKELVPAEFSSKGAILKEIELANGATLNEKVDYKVTYTKESKQAQVGNKELTLEIAGVGAYKDVIPKKTKVAVEVVQGKYYIKDGTIVDTKKATSADKLVSAAKIMDASGAKVKPADVTLGTYTLPLTTIKVSPSGEANAANYKETTLSCRVATKLSSVKLLKGQEIKPQPFDGVNSVTLTEQRIANYLKGSGINKDDIRIVSYKNNNKLGSATVTIEGTESGQYYGTRNLKFKIVLNADLDDGEEKPGTDESKDSDESSDVSGSDEGITDPDDPIVTDRKKIIDVWDFGAKQESDATKYKNHITAAGWNDCANLGDDGKFTAAGEAVFGDLTLNYLKDDRIYSSTSSKTAGSPSGVAAFAYSDGYTAAGDFYCNGTGGDGRRNCTITNVLPGDRIDAYVGTNNTTATDFHFDYLGKQGTQKDTGSIGTTNKKLSFVAKYAGTYKIWADASGGKPIYNRVKRVPAVDVSGTINLGPLTSLEGATLKFVNETTKAETTAVLDGTSFTVSLAAGYTYNAALTGKVGYGPTNTSKQITLTDADALNGKSGISIEIEEKELYAYSGTIKGFATDYARKANLKVIMKTAPDVLNDNVELTITGLDSEAPQFTGTLEPDVEYTITLEGVNDYQVKGNATVNQNKAYTADIEVELRPTYEAKGNFVDLDGKAVTGVTALTFKNVDDEYEYTATIAEDKKSYTANLRDGIYSAEATIEGYQTTEHVIVEGKAASKDILFVSTVAEKDLARKADIYVGYSDKGEANYETVNKAVNAARRMKPAKEEDRITIHIAPGVYREQIIVDVPYVSFVNDTPDKEVKLTWYQGIGYQYYSCVTGWYDAQNAHDQYKKGEPKNWGAAVQIKSTGFLAENIVFEHSLNRYITDEELADGVEPTATSGKPVRDYTLDVKSKAATERGCAMFIDSGGNNAEFYRCKFYSSQDTVGTGKAGAHAYFKECFLEGNTDYICYDGDTIFDNCVLNFYGYSDTASGGYITAAQDTAANGYLFWNCTVTGNPNMKVAAGDFGRPWGQGAKVAFVNTKLERVDIITDRGWTDMSSATAAKANFMEYNTTSLDGKTVNTSKRVANTVKTTNPVPNVAAFKKYFGSNWTPKHYVAEASTVAFAAGNGPEITSNSDTNHPLPGNTLTVKYSLGTANDANDASVIKWYRVKNGTETLVKASTAQAGKTYKIQKTDVGYLIKVEVTPTVASGTAGTKASFQLENAVSEGWEEPGQSDAVLGDGINIFLAGDSTVKDYSAKGMYNSGKAQDLGSWGEFIQEYFNSEKVTIVNYAQGGRSTRNFINEGKLDNIKENIGEGDYLFIQFGHNDCAANYPDRFVPIGKPDASGTYPTTAGTKNAKGEYEYNCGGTFKWFLKQYIKVAKDAGATPVLVTPVARMYYENGKIKTHHDCKVDSSTPANTYASSNDAYVTAYKQVAEEEGVLLLDAFAITKKMYEDAYTAAGKDTYGKQVMGKDDSTHCNKLGGFIEAGLLVEGIKELKGSDGKSLDIVAGIKKPTQVLGKQVDGTTVFTINAGSKLTAYDFMADPIYSKETEYWTKIGQELIDSAVAE